MTQHAITALALASSSGHPRAPFGIIVVVIIIAVVVFFLVRRRSQSRRNGDGPGTHSHDRGSRM
jgi:hypothetical protein